MKTISCIFALLAPCVAAFGMNEAEWHEAWLNLDADIFLRAPEPAAVQPNATSEVTSSDNESEDGDFSETASDDSEEEDLLSSGDESDLATNLNLPPAVNAVLNGDLKRLRALLLDRRYPHEVTTQVSLVALGFELSQISTISFLEFVWNFYDRNAQLHDFTLFGIDRARRLENRRLGTLEAVRIVRQAELLRPYIPASDNFAEWLAKTNRIKDTMRYCPVMLAVLASDLEGLRTLLLEEAYIPDERCYYKVQLNPSEETNRPFEDWVFYHFGNNRNSEAARILGLARQVRTLRQEILALSIQVEDETYRKRYREEWQEQIDQKSAQIQELKRQIKNSTNA